MCRASTSFFCGYNKEDVDGRDKPGHGTDQLNAHHFAICVCSVFSTARSNESTARAGAFLRCSAT
jgi:hypothetical protein